MIKGVGIDIMDISRIEKQILKHGRRFIDRVFSSEEIAYCETKVHRSRHYAARFAAKEAVMKALGTGLGRGMSWHDVVIISDEQGQPAVRLSRKARELAEEMGVGRAHISLSHSHDNAVAMVMLESHDEVK